MNYKELIDSFEYTLSEYESLHENYTRQLRKLLIEFNDNHIYSFDENRFTKLNNAFIDEMKDVFADIKQKHNIKQNTNVQDMFRMQQTSQNRYTSDNQYPPKE